MRRDAAPPLSGAERDAYERDGVVCLRGLFSRDWLAFLADAIAEAMAHPGPHAEEYETKGGAGLDSERFPLAWKRESAHG